jgi:hypothetical protein
MLARRTTFIGHPAGTHFHPNHGLPLLRAEDAFISNEKALRKKRLLFSS